MARLFLIVIAIVTLSAPAVADVLVLDTPQAVTTPIATKVQVEIVKIDATEKLIQVRSRWIDEDNVWIPAAGVDKRGWTYWNCKNVPVPGENAACLDEGDPWECCDGLGTGTCDDMLSTCFSDVFGFKIREQDLGTSIGVGLRTLIMNKWKQDNLTDNSGTFED